MTTSRWTRSAISTAIAVGSVLCGCVGHGSRGASASDLGDRDQIEITCEIALLELDRLIKKWSAETGFPIAALIEATELYALGKELYLEREYALALELVEEAIQLLEEESD